MRTCCRQSRSAKPLSDKNWTHPCFHLVEWPKGLLALAMNTSSSLCRSRLFVIGHFGLLKPVRFLYSMFSSLSSKPNCSGTPRGTSSDSRNSSCNRKNFKFFCELSIP